MIANIMNGRVFKGGPVELTVPVMSECLDYQPNYVSVVFYIEGDTGDTRFEFSTQDDTLHIEGVMGTVYFSEAQLEVLPDGHILYTTYYDDYVTKNWETRLWLVTPTPHQTVEYVTAENVEEIVDEKMAGVLDGYATEDYVNSAITSATSEFMTSGDVDTKLEDYAKLTDIPSLDGYATEQYVDNAVTAGTQNMVTSSTIENIWVGTETQYNNLSQKYDNTLYLIK